MILPSRNPNPETGTRKPETDFKTEPRTRLFQLPNPHQSDLFEMIKILSITTIIMLMAGCGPTTPSTPSSEEIAGILQEPILNSVSYRGADLPREAVRLERFEILELEVREVADEKRLEVSGIADVSLTRSGNEIQGMIGDGGDGGLGAILEMQKFVRALGNTLKRGHVLNYRYAATLAEMKDGSYRIVEGSVSER